MFDSHCESLTTRGTQIIVPIFADRMALPFASRVNLAKVPMGLLPSLIHLIIDIQHNNQKLSQNCNRILIIIKQRWGR